MNVSLTKELDKFIKKKVKSGLYGSSSEVIRDGLRLMRERDKLNEQKLSSLREDIAVGLAQLDRGEGIDGEEAFKKVRKHLKKKRQK